MEESQVPSSTSSIAKVDEYSATSLDFMEELLDEPAACNTVDTIGSEYENILGKPLSERLKNMTETQRTIVLNTIKETNKWKTKYLQNENVKANYLKKIDDQKRQVEELQKEIKTHREEKKVKQERYDAVQKRLAETKGELQKFQAELTQKLRVNSEKERLQREKEVCEKNIRAKSKFTLKCQEKLLSKAVVEKELKKKFAEDIDAMEKVSKLLSENKLLPDQRQKELENNLVDWKMQLALYEDSNMDEIYALHDGHQKKEGNEKKDEQMEEDQQKV